VGLKLLYLIFAKISNLIIGPHLMKDRLVAKWQLDVSGMAARAKMAARGKMACL
jgi:hypothetical protein